jgi:hypothetical protein
MILEIIASLVVPAHAATNCDYEFTVERDRHGAYFDRTANVGDVDRAGFITRLINTVEPGRAILIFDTNPSPSLWAEHNIVTPAHDHAYAAASYDDLDAHARAEIFEEFVERVDRTLRETARPVVIVDHHFKSRLLATTSTTVLVLDFLEWLNREPSSGARDRVRAAFAEGFAIRDHADADIVLANVVTRLAESPDALARFGPIARDIALHNDHTTLPTPPDRRAAALVGHAVFEAFEHHVAPKPGGFRKTLDRALDVLALIEARASTLARASDPIDAFLIDPEVVKDEHALKDVLAHVRDGWTERRDLRAEFLEMQNGGGGIRRLGQALVVDMPLRKKAASGMAILRFVQEVGLATDARALVVVTREHGDPGGPEIVTHVKIRALGPDVNLDPLIGDIIEKGKGGGGRGRAGGLYAAAGREVTAEELADDLAWIVQRL